MVDTMAVRLAELEATAEQSSAAPEEAAVTAAARQLTEIDGQAAAERATQAETKRVLALAEKAANTTQRRLSSRQRALAGAQTQMDAIAEELAEIEARRQVALRRQTASQKQFDSVNKKVEDTLAALDGQRRQGEQAEKGVKDQQVSVVSIDMNIGNLVTRQIIPGMSSTNSIVVVKRGLGGDAGATISKAGLFFNISLNKSEGLHQATRTLIELSAVELMGRLTQVPYWRCLRIEQTNPAMVAEARSWFKSMSEQERAVFAQRVLSSRGYYNGPVHGVFDASTKGAISRYQAENGLLANGRMGFDLYQDFISQDLALGEEPQIDTTVVKTATVSTLAVSLATPKGPAPRYNVSETLDFTAKTTQDSYMYCYYQDGEGVIARLFPNRFNPDPYMVGGEAVSIPSADSQFRIIFEQPGVNEEVTCLASVRELGLMLPNAYKIADLTPLSVGSMAEVIAQHRQLDPEGLAVSTLSIQVLNN